MFNTMTHLFGGRKTSIRMAIGPLRRTMAGYGAHAMPRSVLTAIGRHIVMAIGSGARLTVGPGWAMKNGAGRLITTVAGSITTVIGRGVRVANFSAIAVGGVLHS